MKAQTDSQRLDTVRDAAHRLSGASDDHDTLLELIGDAHFVLLGEASHGSHEFYLERARITQRLIVEKGFDAVAIEGDWPDAYRVNRFVRGADDDAAVADALAGFRRFPTWMWRNTVVVDFIGWLRAVNAAKPVRERVGFYGLDLYSLHGSMEAVLRYLDSADPGAAEQARALCLLRPLRCRQPGLRRDDRPGRKDVMRGGGDRDAGRHAPSRRRAAELARSGNAEDEEEAFNAEQNARLVKNAEQYYRSMYLSDTSSWNLRDGHMVEALGALGRHLGGHLGGHVEANVEGRRARPKIVVWAHNSHLGDARATEMGQHRGELNVGQLVREQHGRDAVLVGFTTHRGSVTAASDWGAAAERKQVVPSRADSHEGLLHATGLARFMLPLRGAEAVAQALREPRLERAIGVIYRPDTERQSHYFFAQLPEQFDAVIHVDETHALEPLEPGPGWKNADLPETYPAGL